ncbi:MAG: ATP-binding cassette domain-containing protein [Alphaproteobacteria bacterium]|nr:ATP-binding cassette domain-containing protein [Alphaproteobacteria bacterium]
MSDALVQFNDVTRHYIVGNDVAFALKEVSCSVTERQHVAVMGASGSGKSTLLALMADLDVPDFGTVIWPGIGEKTSLRPKHVSVSFQAPSLLPSLTIQQNVEVPLLVLGEDRVGNSSLRALDRLGIAHLRDRYPEQISGGQAQRAALARAMVAKPTLLLADEPTGQLDQETGQGVIKNLIEWAAEAGSTLVVATHDPQVASKFPNQWRMSFGDLKTGVL